MNSGGGGLNLVLCVILCPRADYGSRFRDKKHSCEFRQTFKSYKQGFPVYKYIFPLKHERERERERERDCCVYLGVK